MPLQNRVTPFGEIVAVPERGTVMGNRGIIHDPATRTLLKKRWALKCWLICKLRYKQYHREPMARHSWTELFFLDEATALAAGHRPCFFCSREKAEAFRAAWARGHDGPIPRAPDMDAVLHRERLNGTAKRLHALTAPLGRLPDGAMVAAGDRAFLIVGGTPRLWSPAGYRRADVPKADGLLTPPATLAALRAGYRPDLHPSAMKAA
ncbi:MAG TPA: hypothetical protein VHA35_21895 [Dongiaceae bacterium]|jgi:hypothetical protein|nr:hypothetical protein [Dongiaceae bacterium]